ncbi:MAG: hypothetical protein AB7O96_05670 [Pseudobdellovibrionaceae bacterium]
MKISRHLSLLVGILAFSSAVWAAELTSTVQLFNALKWFKFQEVSKENPKIMTLKALIEISYDRMIGRPWTEADYWEQSQLIWTELRKSFCADQTSKLELCALPATLSTVAEQEQILKKLISEKERNLINKKIEDTQLQLTPNLYFPGLSPEPKSDEENLSLRISTLESPTQVDSIDLWSKTVQNVKQIFMNDAVMYDIASYQSGFSMKPVPSYFALDAKGNSYLQIEKIKLAAMEFASVWRQTVKNEITHPQTSAEEILLKEMKKESLAEFEEIYPKLLTQFDPNNQAHQEDIERFEKTKKAGDHPLEVYQHVAYSKMLDLVIKQARYYQWAREQNKSLDSLLVTHESLLTLEKSANKYLYGYLLHRLGVTGEGPLLDQTVSKRVAGMFLNDQISVLLETGVYKDQKVFEKLRSKINYDLVMDTSFFKTSRPNVHAYLEQQGIKTADQLKNASAEVQLQVLRLMVADGNTISAMGVFRLAGVLLVSLDQEGLNQIADIMHEVRVVKGVGSNGEKSPITAPAPESSTTAQPNTQQTRPRTVKPTARRTELDSLMAIQSSVSKKKITVLPPTTPPKQGKSQ